MIVIEGEIGWPIVNRTGVAEQHLSQWAERRLCVTYAVGWLNSVRLRLCCVCGLDNDLDSLTFGQFDTIINHYDALMNGSRQFSLFVQHRAPPHQF